MLVILTLEDDPVKGSKHVALANHVKHKCWHNSVYFVLLLLKIVALTDLNNRMSFWLWGYVQVLYFLSVLVVGMVLIPRNFLGSASLKKWMASTLTYWCKPSLSVTIFIICILLCIYSFLVNWGQSTQQLIIIKQNRYYCVNICFICSWWTLHVSTLNVSSSGINITSISYWVPKWIHIVYIVVITIKTTHKEHKKYKKGNKNG
jgi:hypothetical protein